MDRPLLINLHQVQEFKILLKELKTMRPIIPAYDPNLDNIEKMKFYSAQQQIYDSILFVMNPWKDLPAAE